MSALVLGQSAPPQTPTPQAPVFRAGVNLVTVDAYPVRDGRVIEGLTTADFEVLEDGQPQKVESFEFVRVEPTPASVQRDPNTVGESLKLAADPHNRVFVVFLDTHFVRLDGSHDIRRPLVRMLDEILAPNDLFGVLTPRMRPMDVALGRKVLTTEEELAKYWVWGTRSWLKVQPEGELAVRCYETPPAGGSAANLVDATPIRPVPLEILERSYEDFTLSRLEELITFLGRVREARSSALIVTDGWVLFGKDEALVRNITKADGSSSVPNVFVGPGGKLGQGGSQDPNAMGGKEPATCTNEMVRLARIDDQQRMRDLIAMANRSNVTFNAVNPSGLSAFGEPLVTISPADRGTPLAYVQSRVQTLLTLTRNTDGIAVVNTNDLAGGLKRIVDESSAYYLLGYYSTNTKLDGKYRRIEVRMKQPNVRVTARRGYTAGTEGDKTATAPAVTGPSPVDDALAVLARMRPEAELLVSGVATADGLTVVAEIASHQIEIGRWTGGGDVQVVATDMKGQNLPSARGKIEPGARSVVLKVPIAEGAAGPWTVRATVTADGASIDDRVEIRRPAGALLGAALISRGTPSAPSNLLPVADVQFRRTERVHIEWPVLKALDRREARLLGRDGQPLAVNVAVTERELDGHHPSLAADAVLGPLAPGDYLIELVAGAGAETERQLVAIRIVR
jgi:hypothetical protein